jgi:hypothetical protein
MTKKNKNIHQKTEYGKCVTKVAGLLRQKFPDLTATDAWNAIDAAAHLRCRCIEGLARDYAEEYILDNFGDSDDVEFEIGDGYDIIEFLVNDLLEIDRVKLDEEPVEGIPDAERVLDESIELLARVLSATMLTQVTRTEIVNLLETGVCPECQKKLELMKN